ncbi:MAG: recombinase family protein [Agathobacter sp.]|jgi:DNA invertase Pin-like site-specific DNA recombinase|nr:recombinase family protein [Agathobacter sp.]
MSNIKIYKAAIYVRLSKEDGDVSDASKAESNSISNQKELIKDFLKDKQDIVIVSERVDDGYSGVNFERPAFQLMLEDIKQGKVDCVVVKDLSRFGRNYIESGRYIEKIFPMLGVRFIAINDNYDSLTGKSQTDEIVIPFKNLINDAYCRDISIKIRSHLDVKRRKGEFIGSFTIYGYAKDEHDHNKIVIDEYAAGVVRDIYQWKISGMSQQRIADKLNDMGVLSPAEYKKSCGIKYSANLQTKKQAIWSAVAITRILTNESYTGTLIQGKVTTPNYKVKKTVIKDEEDWVVIPNAFEAIITKEQFDMVQEILKKDTRVAPDKKSVYLFSGIAVCGDCGRQMSRKVSTVSGKKYVYYMCSANKKEGVCSSHRIREDELEKAVVTYLNSYIDELENIQHFLEFIDKLPYQEVNVKRLNMRIVQLEEDAQKYEKLKVSVYEDLKDELISKEEYISMKQEFEKRRRAALDSIAQIKIEIETLASRNGKHHEWIESFLANKGIEKLERNVVVELIDYIKIYEDKRIEIVFRYADNYKEILNQIRYIQDNKNEMQEVS